LVWRIRRHASDGAQPLARAPARACGESDYIKRCG
jgi:hypothetical protein